MGGPLISERAILVILLYEIGHYNFSQQRWKMTIPAPPNSTHHTVDVKGLWYFSADLDADEWGRKEGKKTDGPYYLLQGGEGGATCLLSNS